jgi:hypothetical protein
MAVPPQKLADSLEALKALQERGVVVIRAGNLVRMHRERLRRNGFLQQVIKGWYIPSRPDGTAGEGTAWYASFWAFAAAYLHERFDDDWAPVCRAVLVPPCREPDRTPAARGAVPQGAE